MKSDMDNREWLDDYMSLKQINVKDPFTVPAGYFDELPQHITSRIRLEELKNASAGFTVPENYFDQLSANIQSRINIDSAANAGDAGFTVPENYFEELAGNIQSRLAVEDLLNTEEQGFNVPENYFDELAANIQSRIAVEETMSMHSDGFTVPENYFEQLSTRINNRIVVEEKVQKRGIVRKLVASHTFRYATAACFALVLGIGIIVKNDVTAPVNHNQSFLHQQLSTVPVDEIQSYLQLHTDANDTRTMMDDGQQINSQSLDADLQDYLDN